MQTDRQRKALCMDDVNVPKNIKRKCSHFLSLVSSALCLGSPLNVHWHNRYWLIQQSETKSIIKYSLWILNFSFFVIFHKKIRRETFKPQPGLAYNVKKGRKGANGLHTATKHFLHFHQDINICITVKYI
jgi:hypothetical protein